MFMSTSPVAWATASLGSSTFSGRAAGCVSLLSDGTSGGESAFYDASENGDDVFFITTDRLVASDRDTAYDVYDARVCTVTEPCPSAAVAPPPCTSGDSCKAAPSPQPAIFGAPPSATFNGAGNITPAIPVKTVTKKTAKCAKGKVRRHGKCVKKPKPKRKKSKQASKSNRRAKR